MKIIVEQFSALYNASRGLLALPAGVIAGVRWGIEFRRVRLFISVLDWLW
jgi:hypothetical protein